ncbi:DUF167 domain-containing protein [Novispirillum itersonii]|uniref:UPF0235 protein FHS48_000393 n=1 Tax=Novispirillum itersonii TaxID=189 RepID=A0A7X0DMB3_NOVIT|nr:DUF167 family protein [Novispirillum itersonii]MBB6209012.1 hypothetical protein [Novispirillum itersonii]
MTDRPSAPSGPLFPAAGGVRLHVRLTPKASRDAIQGLADEADGGQVLKASVTAVPEDGKANAALIQLLSKAWKLPKSGFEIIAGATDRRKTLLIHGDTQTLLDHLRQRMPS